MHDTLTGEPLLTSEAAIAQLVSHETGTDAAQLNHYSSMSNLIYQAHLVVRYATILQVTPDAIVYPRLLTEALVEQNNEFTRFLRSLDPAQAQNYTRLK